ncbi:MAG: WbqC family protein [Bacteroidales bacterium]|jgi:hypothetical protein|nr:WbqC family protein [Bacteroidales bacterium]
MEKDNILLSSACFPPIEYFMVATNSDLIIIENSENYIKQTYRNRFTILSGNGLLSIIVPVVHHSTKMPIKEVCIDYKTNWNFSAIKSIKSAYQNSPFFLYYKDQFLPFFQKKYKYLFDYNCEITFLLFKLLNISCSVIYTENYQKKLPNVVDYREIITPKNSMDLNYPFRNLVPYKQVFDDRFSFMTNLSILDLIFNLGPESGSYIKK